MSEGGDKLDSAYRALAREEPRAAIDAAILAASRRALAKPSASRRWAAPVSIAAVLVLAFGVTLHMKEEKPGVESTDVIVSYVPNPPATAPEPAASPAPEPQRTHVAPEAVSKPKADKKAVVQAKPDVAQSRVEEDTRAKVRSAPMPTSPAAANEDRMSGLRDEAAAASERKDLAKEMTLNRAAPVAAPAAPAAPPAMAPQAAPAAPAAARMKREAFTAQAPAGLAADSRLATDEPTRELEAIAKLRAERRDEEADKALAEFRRKRPDYRIPEPMWERVKPR